MKRLGLIAAAAAGVAILSLHQGVDAAPAVNTNDTYQELSLFGEVFTKVRADYVDKVDDNKLIGSAINGMLTSLDPHSNYLDTKDFSDMKVQTRGEFGGLGIEVSME
ncbi:MAG TPA: peptidase S41, partial [Stellaceae bacterium]|nr:peptidase S41 [Stellaceae bacterium]